MIIWWNLTKLCFVKSKNQTHAVTIKNHHRILPKKKPKKKYLKKKKRPTKHSDLIQARKHVCSQNWTLQRFWIDPHGSSSNPEQRLEIYGLFTDIVVVVFCASNIRTLHPSTSNFSLRQNKGNHFAPGKFYHETHTQTFLRCEFWAEMSGNRKRILMQIKNRLKIYIVNNICQTGQKHTFYVEI